jgi:hypothetical protein
LATYTAVDDSYAGFNSTGKYFGIFGLVAGAAGLTGWAAVHGHLLGLKPAGAMDQLFLLAIEWIGFGLCAFLGIATLGSLILSNKSRGTVSIDALGVRREIGETSLMLPWREIEGYVVITGGIALVPREGRQKIEIPRFLDDYRGCIGEIEARGVCRLPPNRLKGCC